MEVCVVLSHRSAAATGWDKRISGKYGIVCEYSVVILRKLGRQAGPSRCFLTGLVFLTHAENESFVFVLAS